MDRRRRQRRRRMLLCLRHARRVANLNLHSELLHHHRLLHRRLRCCCCCCNYYLSAHSHMQKNICECVCVCGAWEEKLATHSLCPFLPLFLGLGREGVAGPSPRRAFSTLCAWPFSCSRGSFAPGGEESFRRRRRRCFFIYQERERSLTDTHVFQFANV
jgi:hypothetical protein